MTPMPPAMDLALQANFGSAERWREAAAALHATHAGEAGRAVLVFQPHDGSLANRWVADGAPDDGGVALLTLADLAAIDWADPYERYQHAVHDASEAFAIDAAGLRDCVLLDVRRAAVFEQATTMLPGARWRDPAEVGTWATDLPAGRAVVVYCVYGHEVGRATALRLRAAGRDARFLRGGIDGWQTQGRPLEAKAGPL